MQCTPRAILASTSLSTKNSSSLQRAEQSERGERTEKQRRLQYSSDEMIDIGVAARLNLEKLINSCYTNDPTKEKGPSRRVEGTVALVVLQSNETALCMASCRGLLENIGICQSDLEIVSCVLLATLSCNTGMTNPVVEGKSIDVKKRRRISHRKLFCHLQETDHLGGLFQDTNICTRANRPLNSTELGVFQ